MKISLSMCVALALMAGEALAGAHCRQGVACLDEKAVVAVVGKPDLVKRVEDSPGVMFNQYLFAKHPGSKGAGAVYALTLQFKPGRINLQWPRITDDPAFAPTNAKGVELARLAANTITGGIGAEVDRIMAGETVKSPPAKHDDIRAGGSCLTDLCFLTIYLPTR